MAQGRKAVTVNGETYLYDPFHYLVLSSHLHFQAEILEASPTRPFLSFVLQIEPALVRRVSSDMLERRTTAFRSRLGESEAADRPALVSALDQELLGAVLRFLRAVGTDADRRVLAPLYLQEMVYRVLQREQFARLLAIAAAEAATNPVSAVLDYVRAHLSEPLTVADMAEQVSLSPSAFAHLFRDVTGRSPYQFLKEMRLDRARELLVDGNLAVARVSKEVGYASVSHFISEFRGRFGVTPRAYCDMNAMNRELGAAPGGNAGPQHQPPGGRRRDPRLDLVPASGLQHEPMNEPASASPASDRHAAGRPRHGAAQVLRRSRRARRHRPGHRRGHGVRPARAERLRQDDHGPDPVHPARPPTAARSAWAGHDLAHRTGTGPRRDRRHRPVLRGGQPAHRAGEPRC